MFNIPSEQYFEISTIDKDLHKHIITARIVYNFKSIIQPEDINNKKELSKYFIEIIELIKYLYNYADQILKQYPNLNELIIKIIQSCNKIKYYYEQIPTVYYGEYVLAEHFNSINMLIYACFDFLNYFLINYNIIINEIIQILEGYNSELFKTFDNLIRKEINVKVYFSYYGTLDSCYFDNFVTFYDSIVSMFYKFTEPLTFLQTFTFIKADINNTQWCYLSIINALLILITELLVVLSPFVIIKIYSADSDKIVIFTVDYKCRIYFGKFSHPLIAKFSNDIINCISDCIINGEQFCPSYDTMLPDCGWVNISCDGVNVNNYTCFPILFENHEDKYYILYFEDDQFSAYYSNFMDQIYVVDRERKLIKLLLNTGAYQHTTYAFVCKFANTKCIEYTVPGYTNWHDPDIYVYKPRRIFTEVVHGCSDDGSIFGVIPDWFSIQISSAEPFTENKIDIKIDDLLGITYKLILEDLQANVINFTKNKLEIEFSGILDGILYINANYINHNFNGKFIINKVNAFELEIKIQPQGILFATYNSLVSNEVKYYSGSFKPVPLVKEVKLLTIQL